VALVRRRVPQGETEIGAFGGIFSGLVITEKHVVVAKFLRGSNWIPLASSRHMRGGFFADKPDSADEIHLWGTEIHSGDQQYTVGVWNWRSACEIIERARANAKGADVRQRSRD
jgi:hypothetical protein